MVTPEMIEAADRANCAAEPDEGWQDETDMYPVIYEAMKALDPEVERLRFDLGNMTIRCRHLLRCFDKAIDDLTREDAIFIGEIRAVLAQEQSNAGQVEL